MLLFFIISIFVGLIFLASHRESRGNGNVGLVRVEGVIDSSREVIKHLVDFRDNDDIKAIILRVDSPGGGITPSQEIFAEVLKTKSKKPVVVSMGSLAASGGYYVACPASRIVANPSSITGSIGVIMQHFVIEDIAKKFNLRWEIIKAGEVKDMGSAFRMLNPKEKTILTNLSSQLHEQFIQDIAKSRNLPVEEVRAMATGEIFSGEQALKLKLVDELGNEQYALEVAGKLAKINKPKIVEPSNEKHWMDLISERVALSISKALVNNLQIAPLAIMK